MYMSRKKLGVGKSSEIDERTAPVLVSDRQEYRMLGILMVSKRVKL
jgi:hypothetical protein